MPGIAPLHAGDTGGHPALPTAQPQREGELLRPETPQPFGGTVAIPAFFVPPPPPFEEPSPPSAPVAPARRGAPLTAAALAAAGLLVVGGGALALFWRGPAPISALPRIAPDGKDVLHLACDPKSCEDGTEVSLGAARSTFQAGQTDLPLSDPLHVGDNALSLSINRPGMGRDETVKLVVPVAYRVRDDVTTMDAPHPCVTIRVQAPPGTDVRVGEKPIALDPSGAGSYAIDESALTDGPADESRVIAIDVPYVVVPKGRPPESGTVSARVAVAPLRVDAPASGTLVEDDHLVLAGRAAKGASVMVDGLAVAASAEGAFETTVRVGALGERTIETRAGTAALAPRTVRTKVTRVASLVEAAKAFEAQNPLGYDTAMREIAAGKTGEPIVVEGDVVDARGSGHRTLVIVDDQRGCARGPCQARVFVGHDLTLSHGDLLRAYGRVARGYGTSPAPTGLEIDAQFVLLPKR